MAFIHSFIRLLTVNSANVDHPEAVSYRPTVAAADQ